MFVSRRSRASVSFLFVAYEMSWRSGVKCSRLIGARVSCHIVVFCRPINSRVFSYYYFSLLTKTDCVSFSLQLNKHCFQSKYWLSESVQPAPLKHYGPSNGLVNRQISNILHFNNSISHSLCTFVKRSRRVLLPFSWVSVSLCCFVMM